MPRHNDGIVVSDGSNVFQHLNNPLNGAPIIKVYIGIAIAHKGISRVHYVGFGKIDHAVTVSVAIAKVVQFNVLS